MSFQIQLALNSRGKRDANEVEEQVLPKECDKQVDRGVVVEAPREVYDRVYSEDWASLCVRDRGRDLYRA